VRRLAAAEPSYLSNEARDVVGGVSDEVDDGIEVNAWRGDLLRSDVQFLVQVRIIAEPYEARASDMRWGPGLVWRLVSCGEGSSSLRV
jgi:hypothetical protein